MRRGQGLTDAEREPWLASLRAKIDELAAAGTLRGLRLLGPEGSLPPKAPGRSPCALRLPEGQLRAHPVPAPDPRRALCRGPTPAQPVRGPRGAGGGARHRRRALPGRDARATRRALDRTSKPEPRLRLLFRRRKWHRHPGGTAQPEHEQQDEGGGDQRGPPGLDPELGEARPAPARRSKPMTAAAQARLLRRG